MENRVQQIEKKQHKQDLVLLKMSTNMEHMAISFDEMKASVEKNHEKMSEFLERMAELHQIIGGFEKLSSDLYGKVEENTAFRVSNHPMLEDIRNERKDTKRRLKDAAWKFGWIVLGAGLTIYIVIMSQINAAKFQDENLQTLTSQLESLIK